MAKTAGKTVKVAQNIIGVSKTITEALVALKQSLDLNSDLAIDWTTPDPEIPLDPDGSIQGIDATPAEIANAVFSLDQVRRVLENESATQGDHLGNLNQIIDPSVQRVTVKSS